MLINLSNHPLSQWSEQQIGLAKQYGKIVDLPFPEVDPEGDETYIEQLAEEYVQKILSMTSTPEEVSVHIMGEMTLTYAIVQKMQAHHIQCVASTTRRIVTLREDNTKEVKFDFAKFRSYEPS